MISQADLIARFGEQELAQLTDRQHYQSIDNAVIAHAIADAEAQAESYLRAAGLVARNSKGELTYIAALNPPKALIINLCDIARYYLYEDGVTEIVEARYKQAIAWLKEVMRSPAMLTGAAETTAANGSSGIALAPNPVPSQWRE